jgi:hypothetical protein
MSILFADTVDLVDLLPKVHNPLRMAECKHLSSKRDVARDELLTAIRENHADVGIPHLKHDDRVEPMEAWVFIGESRVDAARVLFEACHHALHGRDASAAETLRRFVARAADEYAQDNEGCF